MDEANQAHPGPLLVGNPPHKDDQHDIESIERERPPDADEFTDETEDDDRFRAVQGMRVTRNAASSFCLGFSRVLRQEKQAARCTRSRGWGEVAALPCSPKYPVDAMRSPEYSRSARRRCNGRTNRMTSVSPTTRPRSSADFPEYTRDRAGNEHLSRMRSARRKSFDEIGYAGADDKGPYEQPLITRKTVRSPRHGKGGPLRGPVGQALCGTV